MITIFVFLSRYYTPVEKKHWIKTKVQALPRKGDEFEMEKGKIYKVESVRFFPKKNGTTEIQVWIKDPSEKMTTFSKS